MSLIGAIFVTYKNVSGGIDALHLITFLVLVKNLLLSVGVFWNFWYITKVEEETSIFHFWQMWRWQAFAAIMQGISRQGQKFGYKLHSFGSDS